MSYPPGVPIARSLYATTTVPSGAMVVQMAPVRQVAMPMMVRPVMQTVISQPRPAFVSIQQQIPQIMNPTPIMQPQSQQIWINSAVAASSGPKLTTTTETSTENNENANDANEPAITLFIGNITERATDTLVRQILMHCGSVHSWKRVQGASGKLQAFGFCEYKDPESALRAIHILHDRQLGEKKLLVKVDAKSQELIDEWKKDKGMEDENEDGSKAGPEGIEHARANIELMLSEYASELNTMKLQAEEKENVLALPQHQQDFPTVRESKNVEENLEELALEKDKKEFISKEIRSFRESQKLQEEQTKGQREEREKEKVKEKDRERGKRESRDKERERDKTRERERRRTRTPPRRSIARRSRTRSPRRRSPVRRRTPPRRSPVRSSSRRLSPPPRRRRSPSGSPSWRRGDDDDQASERRRLERKIREKEAAYQERLGAFEQRERRKKRDLEKRDERDLQQRKDMIREAKRLREFLADYDDDRSDSKYYVGSSLAKRQRERERERDLDERDRKKEQDEVEILRKRLIQEDHPDHDAAIAKVILETENMWKPLIEPDTPPHKSPSPKPVEESSSGSSSDEDSDDSVNVKSESSDSGSEAEAENKQSEQQMVATLQPMEEKPNTPEITNGGEETNSDALKMKFYNPARASPSTPNSIPPVIAKPFLSQSNVFEAKMETNHSSAQLMNNQKRKKLTVSDVFNQDEDEDELPKKRKLVPLQYTDEERKALNPLKTAEDEKKQAEKKRKMVRALIERIPTQKDDLFDYTLDWSMVDDGLMEKRIQPWITKKIMEYIGEEEPTLVEFICSKILTKSSPEKILEDISMVLDDEAEVFVVKMWRLLIYETEAKKEGLTK